MRRVCSLFTLCLGLVLVAGWPGVAVGQSPAAPSDRLAWSYAYGERVISLTLEEKLGAVLLDEGFEDELSFVRGLARGSGAFELPAAEDLQAYPHLWFLRFRPGVAAGARHAALEGLNHVMGVRFASVILSYGRALLVPRPEVIVILEESAGPAALASVLAAGDLRHVREFPALRPTALLSFDGSPLAVFERAWEILALPGVASAEPAFILKMEPPAAPNDPRFPNQWHHQNTGQTGGTPGADVHSVDAWDGETGSPSITIAILDEGVDVGHEDLAPRILPGHDSTTDPSPGGVPGNAASGDGHGTACAGIAAAAGNNGLGVAGVSWNSMILPVRLGFGSHWTETSWIVDAITWATDNGADVLSNSWGGGAPTTAVEDAIAYARTAGRGGLGCPVLFSSGNDNGSVIYPAAYPSTIAVGASSPCDERKSPTSCDGETWWGSNFGPELTLVVPGVLIDTTDITGGGGYVTGDYVPNFNGTSSACPLAAGAVALLLSALPGLTVDEVETFLANACDDQVGVPAEDTPGWDQYMGHGRLNVATLIALTGGVAGPSNLVCVVSGADASLTWQNGDAYDSVLISRDGTLIATLPGGSSSYLDAAPPPGLHSYGVRGQLGGELSLSASCSIFLTGGATDLVLSAGVGIVDGGAALKASLEANGRSTIETTDLGIVGDLSLFERIWVNLGIFPDNHVLTSQEGTLLAGFLSAPGQHALYMEGGDTWAFDTQTAVHPFFNISGLADGASDLGTVLGGGSGPCDLTGIDIDYVGENAWIDHLGPVGGAITVQANASPAYDTAIFFDGGSYASIGSSQEFGGFSNGASTRDDLLAAYLGCLGFGVSPVSGLVCSQSGAGVQLGWTNGDAYDSIEVVRDGVLIASLPGASTSYSDAAAGYGQHDYTVTGIAGGTPSGATPCAVTVAPPPVVGLACAENLGSVDLSWANGDTYDSLEVRRDGSLIAILAGTATSHQDILPGAGSHSYSVTAVGGGVSSSSASCGVTVPPLPVSGLLCTLAGITVDLTWTNGEAYTGLEIRRGGALIASLAGTATAYTDPAPGAGAHQYSVTGVIGGISSSAVTCDVTVAPDPQFVRGDGNSDGSFNISDAITVVAFLFGGQAVPCVAALDANDDEVADVSDVVSILAGVFGTGPLPPAPFPACASDPTPGALPCVAFPSCP
ncbi:MAG: S8 family serine peptidase [Planctomycetota bacterium]